MGAINTLGLSKTVKAKILQASTSEVYDDSTVQPKPESYFGNVNPIGIRSCYDKRNIVTRICLWITTIKIK